MSWNETVKDVRKDRGIWKFTSNGQGGGAWTLEQASNSEVFKGLNVVASMAYAAGGGRGWSVGGIMTGGTDPDANITSGGVRIPGMVEYEFETQKWTNHSEVGFLKKDEALEGGRAHFVDGLGEDGKNGVVMVLGGGVFALPVTRKGDSRGIIRPDLLLDFNNVTFFDADEEVVLADSVRDTADRENGSLCRWCSKPSRYLRDVRFPLLQSLSGFSADI